MTKEEKEQQGKSRTLKLCDKPVPTMLGLSYQTYNNHLNKCLCNHLTGSRKSTVQIKIWKKAITEGKHAITIDSV